MKVLFKQLATNQPLNGQERGGGELAEFVMNTSVSLAASDETMRKMLTTR